MAKKLTYEYVKSKFEEEGYELLSTEYINNRTKLKYKCPNNHIHDITFHKFIKGRRCPYCLKRVRYKQKDVEILIKLEGWKLLDIYKHSKLKVKCSCPKNHVQYKSLAAFKKCRKCEICDNTVITLDYVTNYFSKFKYVLLSTSYSDAHSKLVYRCPIGHVHSMSWSNFLQVKRCPTCAKINNSGENCHLWQGGISSNLYCSLWSDKGYKIDIRERDNNICQNPYCYKNDKMLSIHHIDYDKKNCHPSNLITVCRSCNSKANKDRAWHMEWYRIIMNKKFWYKY